MIPAVEGVVVSGAVRRTAGYIKFGGGRMLGCSW